MRKSLEFLRNVVEPFFAQSKIFLETNVKKLLQSKGIKVKKQDEQKLTKCAFVPNATEVRGNSRNTLHYQIKL